ncbi:formimidoylglutamase [Puteibacter caeruleilacunae]|nr:formimidoylglutamase [Puteibacter caeruleilacunae]
MQNIIPNNINARYISPEKRYWTGRQTTPDMGIQYWHQLIEMQDAQRLEAPVFDESITLIGYVSDEGVRRNHGRIGACKGPEALRDRLAKLPVHFDSKRVIDLGDIVSIDGNMEACQKMLSDVVCATLKMKSFPIIIGGGHDLAYGHFKGISKYLKDSANKKIGIINFDAHFDLRPVAEQSNSGTPFYQILSEFKDSDFTPEYFAIGIQQQSNTKELFQVANSLNINYALNYDCESSEMELKSLKAKLKPFIERNDLLYITIDMDGFSSAYAPGVSAPSPLGFTPFFIFKLLSFLFESGKVISFDIAELNPELDRDNLTALLAAKIVDFVLMNLNLRTT